MGEVEPFGISCRNIQNRLDLSRSGEIYMKMLSVFPFLFISLEFKGLFLGLIAALSPFFFMDHLQCIYL